MSDASPSDELLLRLQAAKKEVNELLATLFHRYHQRLRNTGMRRGLTFDQADDAVQQTLVNLDLRLDTFDRKRGTADQWISGIFNHAVADQFRGRNPEKPIPGNLPAQAGTAPGQAETKSVKKGNTERKRKQVYVNLHCIVMAVESLDDDLRKELRRVPGERGGASEKRQMAAQCFQEAFRACRQSFPDQAGDEELFEE